MKTFSTTIALTLLAVLSSFVSSAPTAEAREKDSGPWTTVRGQAAFEDWIRDAMARLNNYNGSPEYNSRKPYSINKYGLLEGRGIRSAYAPDNFPQYRYNRYHYMWDLYVQTATGDGGTAIWSNPNWNGAGVPALRSYVLRRAGAAGK